MNSLLYKEALRALRASASFYSEDTGMIHLSYKERPFRRADSIPLYHNLLYALALLQNKEKETMQKGMHLVAHLLCFQLREGKERGAFPRYLHEYPKIERRYEVVDLLLPLIWIYQDFKVIFPESIRLKLSESIEMASQYLFEFSSDREPSYLLNIQLGCLSKKVGELLGNEKWIQKGSHRLKKLFSKGPDKSWGSSRHLSKMMLYLELLSFEDMPGITAFYNYLKHSWHPATRSYLGPGMNEHLYKSQQEPTLYHELLSKELNQKPYSLFEADLMETVLIKKGFFDDHYIKKESLKYALGPFSVEDSHLDKMGYSFFNFPKELWEKRGGFYPFKLLMENKEGDPHSFALQMGSFVSIKKVLKSSLLLSFENSQDKELDISFYSNLSSKARITQNGKKASMFNLLSPIEFDYGTYRVLIEFPGKEKGIWAQLCRGNRRSQIVKEFNQTYDLELYFRRIEKVAFAPFQIKLEITQI